MAKELTWVAAIEKVLREANQSMHYKDITEAIIEQGLRTNLGATPSATVSAQLTRNPDRFHKVGPGEYEMIGEGKPSKTKYTKQPKNSQVQEEAQYAVITSFGMFWRREAIEWTSNPKILGTQQLGADAVDFNKQTGIYLLYDGREIIYVGRATDQPIGKRLYQHTFDRLSTRWDRFSWFGLLPVSDKGTIGSLPESYEAFKIVPAMEAILIEALEPRQNRKRGDDLMAVEYIQREDPALQDKIKQQILEEALSTYKKKR